MITGHGQASPSENPYKYGWRSLWLDHTRFSLPIEPSHLHRKTSETSGNARRSHSCHFLLLELSKNSPSQPARAHPVTRIKSPVSPPTYRDISSSNKFAPYAYNMQLSTIFVILLSSVCTLATVSFHTISLYHFQSVTSHSHQADHHILTIKLLQFHPTTTSARPCRST